ncbi:Flagellar biosynthesis protein FliR [hydrothermal vent metagenome]|uniref:Flagellar biosynthesis protein FliR n=1 Tax=hydrothermal vent metagenome TaxID=652676 RepID=A0A3B0ZFJ8_9ZZZZ
MNFTDEQIVSLVTSYFWPFIRIAAFITVVPVFGARVIPTRIRMMIAIALTIVIVPILPPPTAIDPLGVDGMLITMAQVMIGLAMGFAVKLIFSAIETGGHIMAQTMGLGFAQMNDPANGVTVPVVSQFYIIMATLLFLALNGHLVVIDVLAESFTMLPVSMQGISPDGIWMLIEWSSWIFTGAVLMSLPVVVALLLINVAFGVMMRAAPQLNVFAVGFPLTLTFGFIFMWASLEIFLPQFNNLFEHALMTVGNMLSAR